MPEIRLGSKIINNNNPAYIIGEIGINHMGDINIAKKLIQIASLAGADAVKFQKRDVDATHTKADLEKIYSSENAFGPTYGDHKRFLEFNKSQYQELMKFTKENKLDFICTPWDLPSVDFLEELGLEIYKISSADLTNIPLINKVAKLDKPILLSSGMSSIEQIDKSVDSVLELNDQLAVLYCVSTYPSRVDEINLNIIRLYKERYDKCIIGYSGHELGISISLAAVLMGAKIIERHITLDRTLKGSDQAASLEFTGFMKMIRDIRVIEKCTSNKTPFKIILKNEIPVFKKLGKSLVSKRYIEKGSILTSDDITLKSPGIGINYHDRNKIINKKAIRDIQADIVLSIDDFE